MDIRILPSNIANMIAAGEVVQRPASVVKELMENAVDAGATKISVIIRDAGRTMVQVIDNGCGMTPDQAVLCFQRHATSKIATAEDLQAIETFGFRGEALASIAAVAEVTLKTRTCDSDVATMVKITDATASDPGKQDISEVAAPVGSNFAVYNLYYNTPARRKFLKSDASELKQIIQEFIRVALCRTDIAFSLTANDREIYRLSPAATTLYRIRDIFGAASADEMLPVDARTTVASISGFAVRPTSVRKTAQNQFFFVNGRFFRSPYLHKAVMKAYENLIPGGMLPSYFIYLDVDPHTVDINVHPTKTEIKFEDDNVLFTILMASVKDALGRESFGERLDFDSGDLPQIHNVGRSFDEYKDITEPSFGSDTSFNPFENDGFPNQSDWETPGGGQPGVYQANAGQPREAGSFADFQSRREAVPQGWFDAIPPGGGQAGFDQNSGAPAPADQPFTATAVVRGRYVIAPSRSGIMVVDAVRAMQRILYEEFLQALSCEKPVSQMSLFPVEVEVGAANIPLVEANSELLMSLGFDITPISTNTVVVNGVPEGLVDDRMSISALVYEIITALGDEQSSIAGSIYDSLAGKLSSSAARTATIPTDGQLARALIDRLYSCDNPEFTSDGHKVVAILGTAEFDKLFN